MLFASMVGGHAPRGKKPKGGSLLGGVARMLAYVAQAFALH